MFIFNCVALQTTLRRIRTQDPLAAQQLYNQIPHHAEASRSRKNPEEPGGPDDDSRGGRRGEQVTFVGLQELADEPKHLSQDFTGRQGQVIVQEEVLDGRARGSGQIDPVEQAGVQLGGVEARGNLKLQHHVELIRAVNLSGETEKSEPGLRSNPDNVSELLSMGRLSFHFGHCCLYQLLIRLPRPHLDFLKVASCGEEVRRLEHGLVAVAPQEPQQVFPEVIDHLGSPAAVLLPDLQLSGSQLDPASQIRGDGDGLLGRYGALHCRETQTELRPGKPKGQTISQVSDTHRIYPNLDAELSAFVSQGR